MGNAKLKASDTEFRDGMSLGDVRDGKEREGRCKSPEREQPQT